VGLIDAGREAWLKEKDKFKLMTSSIGFSRHTRFKDSNLLMLFEETFDTWAIIQLSLSIPFRQTVKKCEIVEVHKNPSHLIIRHKI